MRLGVLDIGSNTGHLLVVDAARGAAPMPAYKHKEPLRLAEHLDACLGCRGCEPACPSGVGYGRGLEAARDLLFRARRLPALARLVLRIFARELIRVRKQSNRLHTSKAQLNSVQMQVNEAFSVRKIEGSIKASTGIMKDVNSLVRLPELTGTMRELSSELMKAGIIEEMVDDTLMDTEGLEEDEEAEEEVDKVLSDILKDRLPASKAKEDELPSVAQPAEEEEEDDQEEMLAQMRGRLEALKS